MDAGEFVRLHSEPMAAEVVCVVLPPPQPNGFITYDVISAGRTHASSVLTGGDVGWYDGAIHDNVDIRDVAHDPGSHVLRQRVRRGGVVDRHDEQWLDVLVLGHVVVFGRRGHHV